MPHYRRHIGTKEGPSLFWVLVLATLVILAMVSCGEAPKTESLRTPAPAVLTIPDGVMAVQCDVTLQMIAPFIIEAAKKVLLGGLAYVEATKAIKVTPATSQNLKEDMLIDLHLNRDVPFTIDEDHAVVVVFKTLDADTGKEYWGAYSGKDLIFSGGDVGILTKHFGVFQGFVVNLGGY